MTNEAGHTLARAVGDVTTLGAYRRGNRISWIPGALIDVWVPCARGEAQTGVPSPHVYFVQTLGERSSDSGSIHCPACRAELRELRASGKLVASGPVDRRSTPAPAMPAPQSALPF